MVGPDLRHERIKSGAALLEQLDSAGVRVDMALWHYSSQRENWRLILSLPKLARKAPLRAYEAIQNAYNRIPAEQRDLDLTDITLSPAYHELLKRLRVARRKGELRQGIRISHHGLQGMLIEDAYIYRVI